MFPNQEPKTVPSLSYIGNAIMRERSDQIRFPKLAPFLVPKSVTAFSVCLRKWVSILKLSLLAEIGTSGGVRPQLSVNEYLANAYGLESLGDCDTDCGMVWTRAQAREKLVLQQSVSGSLV